MRSIVSGLLNQEITTIYSTAHDGYGRITKTTVYSDIPCRWQEMFQLVTDKEGNEVVAKVQTWLPEQYEGDTIDVDDEYIFLYNSREYAVINYEYHYNMLGEVEYIKVYLK